MDPGMQKIESARPAVAVIDSLAAECRQQDVLSSRTPSSLPGAARALFVHHLAQNGAAQAHHIIAALSVGRTMQFWTISMRFSITTSIN